jgi:c-di-GMP-related signal transduction protein
MDDVNFIVREPLLDPKGRVLGYGLSWQENEASDRGGRRLRVNSLIAAIAEQRHDTSAAWRHRGNMLFVDAVPALLSPAVTRVLPRQDTVFTLAAEGLKDPATFAAVKELRSQGFGIALKDVDLAKLDRSVLQYVTYLQVRHGSADFATQISLYASLEQSSIRMAVRGIGSWQEYAACAERGLDVFAGNLYLTPRPGSTAKGLNPVQNLVLQLMHLVRQNADVRQLEDVLRRDAGLAYELLHYINTVGFGLGTEIQSLHHAVTMLGYSPLYRWLSMLLVKAGAETCSPALMENAIIRGRFAELLGQGFLPKYEAENLFIAGMFSLLDRLIGIPMEEVLENTHLSDAISQALLSRTGIYGSFLALAEACESKSGRAGELADALFIGASQVNEAHLSALAWAQDLKL